MRQVVCGLALGACLFSAMSAAEPVRLDQVQLAASAEREVINDIIVATLFIEREGADQAKLGALVNEAMSWALAEAGKAKEVKVTTGQYTTFPVYTEKSNGVSAWRVRQSLRLEGRNGQQVGQLIARLQEKLAVEAVDYAVSAEGRASAEEALTSEALRRFQQRAQQVAAALGRKGYKLVTLEVGALGAQGMPVHPVMYRAQAMVAADAPAQLSPGTQNLSLTVSGTVQLDNLP